MLETVAAHNRVHTSLDSIDASIVHLLQIAPLARWADVGAVLDIAPSTAARRWERLRKEGCAWTTVYPANALMALVEIDTIPTAIDSVAQALTQVPGIVTIERMAGDRDVLCTMMADSVGGLSDVLQARVSSHPDLRSSRAQIVTRLYLHGAEWKLRAVSARREEDFVARAGHDTRRAEGTAPLEWSELDRNILVALSDDARIPLASLAERVGASVSTARRRLRDLIRTRRMAVRTEIARGTTDWPVSVTLWAYVDAHRLQETASIIRTIPEARMCASVTGQNNLVFQMWLRSTDDVPRVEAVLSKSIPSLRIVDRAIALKQFKLMGRTIDATGHAIAAAVPIEPWEQISVSR